MVTIEPVLPEQKEILRNLLEKYLCEFSQWTGEAIGEDGLYGYRYLDCYWTEPNRFPYLIRVNGKLAGFALVNDYPEVPIPTEFCMSEFFILYPYRRGGVGREAARLLFDRHRGRWQLKYHPHNTASVRFWNQVVGAYTGGSFTRLESYPNPETFYPDGTPADVLLFDTAKKEGSA